MAKTVLITGASSGIGRATVIAFQRYGWNVSATMRSPDTSDLASLDRVICPRLDVTDPASITTAFQDTLAQFQTIDVVVNNAGYGLMGPFESISPEQIERQFSTNVFGVMQVTRAVLPHFRERQQGVILNVTSVGGQVAFPLYSLYHSTKWALEGFSESLLYELEPFNIHVKLIEPGPIKTDFYGRSADRASTDSPLPAYAAFVKTVMATMNRIGNTGSPPEVVAETIYRAATDGSKRLRYPTGGNAPALLALRKLLPDWAFQLMIRKLLIK